MRYLQYTKGEANWQKKKKEKIIPNWNCDVDAKCLFCSYLYFIMLMNSGLDASSVTDLKSHEYRVAIDAAFIRLNCIKI